MLHRQSNILDVHHVFYLFIYLFLFLFSEDNDDCVNHACANGGSCLDGINHYSCDCAVGYTGNRCETGKIYELHSQ